MAEEVSIGRLTVFFVKVLEAILGQKGKKRIFAVVFYSEPAASVGSDDESNAATYDGSTLRTPAEPAGSSESGGSGVDESIGGASGRSSSTCDQMQMHSSPPRFDRTVQSCSAVEMLSQPEPSTSTAHIQEEIREEDSEDNNEAELIHKLHVLR